MPSIIPQAVIVDSALINKVLVGIWAYLLELAIALAWASALVYKFWTWLSSRIAALLPAWTNQR